MPRLRLYPQIVAGFAPPSSSPPASAELEAARTRTSARDSAQASEATPSATPPESTTSRYTFSHPAEQHHDQDSSAPAKGSENLSPLLKTIDQVASSTTLPPTQALVPQKFLNGNGVRLRPQALYHPAGQRQWTATEELVANSEPYPRHVETERKQTSTRQPAPSNQSSQKVSEAREQTTGKIVQSRSTSYTAATEASPMTTLTAFHAPEMDNAAETRGRARMYSFRLITIPNTPTTSITTPAPTPAFLGTTQTLTPTPTNFPTAGSTTPELSTLQILLIALLLALLHLLCLLIYLVNFPPAPNGWLAAPWSKTRNWFQDFGFGRRAPRVLRKFRRGGAGGGLGIELDEGSGLLGSARLSPRSPSGGEVLLGVDLSGLRLRRSSRFEQDALLTGDIGTGAQEMPSPTPSDPENYRAWLLAARQSAGDVESGASSPGEGSLLGPLAGVGGRARGGGGWLAKVAQGVDRGVERVIGMVDQHVIRGGTEEGLLLPVRREENREGYLGERGVTGWEDEASD